MSGPQALVAEGLALAIVERVEFADHQRQQVIGQGRVAGQVRAVQVGAPDPSGAGAVGTVTGAVADTAPDPAGRAGTGAEAGDAAVILVAREGRQ